VKIFDAGTNGMDILYRARGAHKLIIIDASSTGSDPGAVFEVPGSVLENPPAPSYTLHDFRWDHALFAGRKIWGDGFPADVSVFLIEAETLAYGLDLSERVRSATEIVTARIEAMIADYCALQTT
jgi:hydrogenase maturation protease